MVHDDKAILLPPEKLCFSIQSKMMPVFGKGGGEIAISPYLRSECPKLSVPPLQNIPTVHSASTWIHSALISMEVGGQGETMKSPRPCSLLYPEQYAVSICLGSFDFLLGNFMEACQVCLALMLILRNYLTGWQRRKEAEAYIASCSFFFPSFSLNETTLSSRFLRTKSAFLSLPCN